MGYPTSTDLKIFILFYILYDRISIYWRINDNTHKKSEASKAAQQTDDSVICSEKKKSNADFAVPIRWKHEKSFQMIAMPDYVCVSYLATSIQM